MKQLLEVSKLQLSTPLRDARRKLLVILNVVYIILVPVFLISEKISNGNFVPDPSLYLIYIPAVFFNLLSAIYNIRIFQKNGLIKKNRIDQLIFSHQEILDSLFGWVSILPIMFMSFCHMAGTGNPSNDAILTDFALAHSLIIGAVIIIGRKGALIWFVVVITMLLWNVNRLGWDYEYHYLTPKERQEYKMALDHNENWALERKTELEKNGLNPPKVSRYFNTWIVFIIVSFMAAYFFSGITIDIFKIIPSVIQNLEAAIDEGARKDAEIEHKQKEIAKSAMRIVRYNEVLDELNNEIEKLDYKDKKRLMGVLGKIRKAVSRETDWENFETKFDSIHNDFFKIIQSKFPDLTQSELKHLAYIRMNLSSTEISRLMDVKVESLRTLRYRLKKKLNLTEDIDLRDFTCNVEFIEQQMPIND